MLQRMIDKVKDTVGNALRLTTLAAVAAIALLIAIAFLCAAAFVWVLQNYGPIYACLAGAALFSVVTLIALGFYAWRKRENEARAERAAKSAAQSVLGDPMVVAAGLQLVRSIGVKRLVPILLVGGVVLGLMASRAAAGDDAPKEP